MAVDPIKHDLGSAAVTAGVEVAKSTLATYGTVIAGSSAAVGVVAAGLTLLAGAFMAIPLGTVAGIGLLGAVLGGAAGVGLSLAGTLPIMTAGGIIGMFRGGKRISRENAAARDKLDQVTNAQATHDAMVAQAAVQQAAPEIFQAGAQAGGQQMAANIRQRMEEQAAAMQGKSKIDPANFKQTTATHAEAATQSKAENTVGGRPGPG